MGVLYDMPHYGAIIYGPCDGLYYLYVAEFRAFWNPTINELTPLPPIITKPNPPANAIYPSDDVYGFGLDPLTEDYKVVILRYYWSMDDDDETPTRPLSCYTVVKGRCFWLGSTHYTDAIYRELIISFDMAFDSFREIPVPNYQRPNYYYSASTTTLGMYEDSLAFFCVHREMNEEGILDIWTFNDGVWTKIFTIGPILGLWIPVGHWQSNKVLLEFEGHKIVLCDPNERDDP
ncbi:hypothetical protein RND81_02G149300 [Saponaria officinalis]|uniref:F-box associated domain-containing protein n=1 Tax=Saponaria officinalis TaxID=3572 RepID=A0AAW1MTH4_SAPOF